MHAPLRRLFESCSDGSFREEGREVVVTEMHSVAAGLGQGGPEGHIEVSRPAGDCPARRKLRRWQCSVQIGGQGGVYQKVAREGRWETCPRPVMV